MDETTQTFRDELYSSAAIGHLKVEKHCERYYRGTNSLHVKKMHTNEAESGFNHNHYRVSEGDVTPADVLQHLIGVVEAQRDLKIVGDDSKEKFLDRNEALVIANLFARHVEDLSKRTSLVPSPDDEFTPEDIAEWESSRHLEEPCRSIEPSVSLAEKLVLVRDSMRGIGSELAHTRQMAGSVYGTSKIVVEMDDRRWESPSDPSPSRSSVTISEDDSEDYDRMNQFVEFESAS
jgi:hypothetical protein